MEVYLHLVNPYVLILGMALLTLASVSGLGYVSSVLGLCPLILGGILVALSPTFRVWMTMQLLLLVGMLTYAFRGKLQTWDHPHISRH